LESCNTTGILVLALDYVRSDADERCNPKYILLIINDDISPTWSIGSSPWVESGAASAAEIFNIPWLAWQNAEID